jgi:Mlc titration factor MtfA (ptsG expression regulator)
LAWTRSGRIRQALEQPFPDEWRALLQRHVAHWRMLDDDERELLEEHIRVFIVDKRWEAANDFALTEQIQVMISAMACLLILGLDYDYYDKVNWIAVHPTTLVLTEPRYLGNSMYDDSPYPIEGQAAFDGPTIIAWDAAREQARHPERGFNVVYHEFAHKLDMLDGTVDGTPPLATDADRARWIEVCTREYTLLRHGEGEPGRVLRRRHRGLLRSPPRARGAQARVVRRPPCLLPAGPRRPSTPPRRDGLTRVR